MPFQNPFKIFSKSISTQSMKCKIGQQKILCSGALLVPQRKEEPIIGPAVEYFLMANFTLHGHNRNEFERILKRHYFPFTSFSSLCEGGSNNSMHYHYKHCIFHKKNGSSSRTIKHIQSSRFITTKILFDGPNLSKKHFNFKN